MVAPSVGNVTATTSATGTAVTGTVPASVVNNSVVIVVVYSGGSTVTGLGTTGLVHAPGSPLLSQPGGNANINILWKRSNGTEPGSYALTLGTSQFWTSGAARIDNAVTSGSPWDTNSGTGTALNNANSANSLTTSMTTGGATELLFNVGGQFTGGTWTQPSGFTKDFTDSVGTVLYFAHLAQAAAGATGTLTTSVSGVVAQMADWLGALLPLAGGSAATPNAAVISSPTRVAVPRPPFLGASQPLGNPAVPTRGPLVVSVPWTPQRPPGATLSASMPLGNPAVPTPGPLVVSNPWSAKVPGALLFGPGAPAVVVATAATPSPLVVTPPFVRMPVPPVSITASQPLGNPAVGTSEPLVSVPAFTLAQVPGARIFAAPQAPVVVAAGTPAPLVVGPQWQPVPIPRVVLSSSFPLGRPAVPSPQPLVVTPVFRWPTWTASIISDSFVFVAPTSCDTPRPFTGTTAYALATTARPGSGTTMYGLATTARPNTGETDPPCG